MNRERTQICWNAVQPLLIYNILLITIRSVLNYLWESAVLAASFDMAGFFLFAQEPAQILIVGLSCAGAVLPLWREGQLEILFMRRKSAHAWIAGRKDSGLLIGILPIGTVCLSAFLNLLLAESGTPGTADFSPGSIPLAAAVYGILTPFVEEVVYRGIAWHRLRKGFSPLQASVMSSLLFGIAHADLRQGFYAFVMGMVFSMSYGLTRRFEVPFLLHCTCNLAVLAASSAGWGEVLHTPIWIIFFAVTASAVFFYWGSRLIKTNYKL